MEAPDEFSPDCGSLLPSALKAMWGDDPRPGSLHERLEPSYEPCRRSPHIGSAPLGSAFRAHFAAQPGQVFYSVWFHKLRTETVAGAAEFDDGDWVIVDADRGFDIGQIVTRTTKPRQREMRDLQGIVRKAAQHEIEAVASKEMRQSLAMQFCQVQARDLGLPMEVIGAEFQFDGRKLTMYYTAVKYIDFRELVRVMFRSYGTRIWMVWCDGGAPVRDVLTRKAGSAAEARDQA